MLTCDRVMKAACSAVVGLNLSGICHVGRDVRQTGER
jgi:hypothetical protein